MKNSLLFVAATSLTTMGENVLQANGQHKIVITKSVSKNIYGQIPRW